MSTPLNRLDASPSLASQVHKELERRILAGHFTAGEKLVEEDVADRLKVSRGPVREAFRALEQAGLVRMEKNRGVFVREITLRDANEIYEVRAGMDELMGRLAAPRLNAEQLSRLRDLLVGMETAARTEDVDAYYPLNVEFHDLLARCTGNATLIASYRILVNQLHLFRRETLRRAPRSFSTSTREHQQIVDALASGDGVRAGQLLFEHAMESRDRLHAIHDKPRKATPRARARTP